MTRNEIKRGIADLLRMRVRVDAGMEVFRAWAVVDAGNESREILLRHVRPGHAPFNATLGPPYLCDANVMPTAHALQWIDTAIAYAEEHGR